MLFNTYENACKQCSRSRSAARPHTELAVCKTLEHGGACESLRLSPCVLVQPDGWARGEREGYGGPYDVTSLSLTRATRSWDKN